MRACVHAHVIVCTHMEKEHACVHACESVQIQVLAMSVLRIACLADAADISRLDARLFKSKFCISLDKQEVYVLTQNEVLVGYVVYLEIDAVIWVKRLGVRPDFQRQGCATQLLRHVLRIAADQNAVVQLHVRVNNEAALQLYMSAGFSQDEMRPRYYANGDNALLLSKRPIEPVAASQRGGVLLTSSGPWGSILQGCIEPEWACPISVYIADAKTNHRKGVKHADKLIKADVRFLQEHGFEVRSSDAFTGWRYDSSGGIAGRILGVAFRWQHIRINVCVPWSATSNGGVAATRGSRVGVLNFEQRGQHRAGYVIGCEPRPTAPWLNQTLGRVRHRSFRGGPAHW